MLTVDEARERIRERVRPIAERETLPLTLALGRMLAAPIRADRADPPFDRSMMDGYAVRAEETRQPPRKLDVIARIAAGDADLPTVGSGQAAWINTGAPLPPGADAVIPVERTRGEEFVEAMTAVLPGANVLRRGTLAREGDAVAEGRLTPERTAICAAQGCDEVEVLRRPRVAVLATGTELKQKPGPHEIRNSNGPMLRALLDGAGCEVIDLGVAGDRPGELFEAVERGNSLADVLTTTGGVSKGDLDIMRPVLEEAGVEIVFHGVALQPGKPVLFGWRGGHPVFALPGNPASALVCADLFLLPYLAAAAGREFDEALVAHEGRLTSDVRASPRRRRFFPCIHRRGEIEPLPWRSSADIYNLGRGNAYLVLEAGCDRAAGEQVSCLVPERFAAAAFASGPTR